MSSTCRRCPHHHGCLRKEQHHTNEHLDSHTRATGQLPQAPQGRRFGICNHGGDLVFSLMCVYVSQRSMRTKRSLSGGDTLPETRRDRDARWCRCCMSTRLRTLHGDTPFMGEITKMSTIFKIITVLPSLPKYSLFQNVAKIFHNVENLFITSMSARSSSPDVGNDVRTTTAAGRHSVQHRYIATTNTRRTEAMSTERHTTVQI